MADEALAIWLDEARPHLQTLMGCAATMLNLSEPSAVAVLAANDQIRAGGSGLSLWLSGHPCPDKGVGKRLHSLDGRFAEIGGRWRPRHPFRKFDLSEVQADLTLVVAGVEVAERLEDE
jgi:hypothetical protein